MALQKPTTNVASDPQALYQQLLDTYNAIKELQAPKSPGEVPRLKPVTLQTIGDLRAHRGDADGELGPRATIVGGGTETLDGGEGVYVWDHTSTAADDSLTVLQPAGVAVGRWKRAAFSNIQTISSESTNNYVLNGGMNFARRQANTTLTTYSNTTGRSYGVDRWGMTNETASMQARLVSANPATDIGITAALYARFVKTTAAGKIIISQVVEGNHSTPARGRVVRLQAKMRCSVASAMSVRLGMLSLSTGTDVVPATFVSAFGASGTDPTWGTNLSLVAPSAAENGTISNSAVTCSLTTSWQRFSAVLTVPATCVNVIPVIWTDSQMAALDELNITEVGLFDGDIARDWIPLSRGVEIVALQRYYAKTFATNTAPAQNVGTGTGELRFPAVAAAGAAFPAAYWQLPTLLRGTPTVVTYNPSAANAQVRDITGAQDCSATAAVGSGNASVLVTGNTGATTAAVNSLGVHITADAEL